MHIVPIDGGVCASLGFESSAVSAGIKNQETSRLDCALVVSREKAVVGGVFTTNMVKAAPVIWCKKVCERGIAQAVFINSGNANACTGEKGLIDVESTAKEVARLLKISEEEVLVLSTGVIGVPLPMERILKGVNECVKWLSPEHHLNCARAIMTTDTVPKEYAVAMQTNKGVVRIGGMAKGAGMICPNMATMLSVITTDAKISKSFLQSALSSVVSNTFNCIAVDNDMSTNDSVVVLANGMSGIDIELNEEDKEVFLHALYLVCERLAKSIVRDGEGATKFVEIEVVGAKSRDEAKRVAKSVAVSQLCKTAFFGGDPNWGRIVCAVGYSGVPVDPNKVSLWIADIKVFEKGVPTVYEEELVANAMKNKEIRIKVDLGMGGEKVVFWTSDLSYDYVKINANYRT
ncbi:MAG: bifunctional glutamate N-acetyltransferase/amino-acid acetyltransferase ArgJ [Candidatus Hydrogenedentes bacterium]|nr:bifunctional glutamate N-acetyltransferase/amino-acid acetyltransferase ArgJ [Candidatus Hydrogenedentota bacterium]